MNRRKQGIDTIGLIGLGLMGQGIASCLIANGIRVVGYSRSLKRESESQERIGEALAEMVDRKIIPRSRITGWQNRFSYTAALEDLAECPFVIETVKEDLALKRKIYNTLESCVSPRTVIATNTSALPITLIQQGRKRPDRFIGMHWAEPAEITRYLEIIRGKQTSDRTARIARQVGEACGKSPTVLNFDIRGFISNRLMYAMMREACYLVESGVADTETVDRSFRNDIGWWATIAGPFRWMDLTGIPAYGAVMKGLLPELNNRKTVPRIMRDMVRSGAEGITNRKGFYKYTRASANEWKKVWLDFTHDIRKLVAKYEKRVHF
jgi:3-hydroxybutyryl-CoA dehydrogenase